MRVGIWPRSHFGEYPKSRPITVRLAGIHIMPMWNDVRMPDFPASASASAPALVPELLVSNLDRSIGFWCGLCGFNINYSRSDERFAYIAPGLAWP